MDTLTKIKPKTFDDPLPLLAHLGELRTGITKSVVAIALCAGAMYPDVDRVILDLARPVGKLYFIGPVEAFWARLKIAFFLGVLVSLPFVLYQLWSFIQRGLLPKEKHSVAWVTIISCALFIGGAAFCYLLVLPVGVKFLMAYGSDTLVPMITISRYLSFATALIFSFGLVFELPVVVGFLVKAGLLQPETLQKQWRFAVVLIFIAAAVLTPGPDIFSQLIMAGPLLVLYGVSIIVARILKRRNQNG